MTVVGAILAAGSSSRLGRPKQLVPVGGEPLVRRTARIALASPCAEIAVVLGAATDDVARALDGLSVALLPNPAWSEGVASSIRTAAAWARARSASAVLLLVCDQPRLSAEHLGALLAEHARTGGSVGSRYRDVVGVPAVFPAHSFDALSRLTGDRGARTLLGAAAAIPWEDGAIDVDSEADVAALE